MATITISLTSPSLTGSRSFTIPNTAVARFIAANRILQRMPEATDAQVLSAWAEALVKDSMQKVKTTEAMTAITQLTDIAVT